MLIVVAAIAALVAIIVLCVKHWDTIKSAATSAAQAIAGAFEPVLAIFDKIASFLTGGVMESVGWLKDKIYWLDWWW